MNSASPVSMIEIRRLTASDADAYRTVRLRGLRECPSAFGSSYTEDSKRSLESFAQRLTPTPANWTFGAFAHDQLVGTVSLIRFTNLKERHKAGIYGMFVTRRYRGHGTGRELLETAIAQARKLRGVRQLQLGVNASNLPAKSLYETLGFKPYGLEEDAIKIGASFHSELLMALRL